MDIQKDIEQRLAGVDISTGHATDSFFNTNTPLDPWASRCLTTLADSFINHNQVFYPLPSKVALAKLDEHLLPLIFVEGQKHGLIRPKMGAAADQVQLPPEELAKELENFYKWAIENSTDLKSWMRLHRESPRIAISHPEHVPKHQVEEFLETNHGEELAGSLGMSFADFNYAFDVFARSVQYYHVLGESTRYFAHPIRDRAFGHMPILTELQKQWSWGRYFLRLIQETPKYKDIGWMLDKVSSIRNLTQKYNAAWYDLVGQSQPVQIELLETIASECDLPAKLKTSTRKKINATVNIGAGMVSAYVLASMPVVAVILQTGSTYILDNWNGAVSGKLGRVSIFKGHLQWDGLVSKQKEK
ncbi:MAG: hypothetical protein H7246_01020 [Phycisphaerae bacterium]|nr:hypothetical protein [Saprospiraceae bacterium]